MHYFSRSLLAQDFKPATNFFTSKCGIRNQGGARVSFNLEKSLTEMGITRKILKKHAMPLQREPKDLVYAGLDIFQRPQKMTQQTFEAWNKMKSSAKTDGFEIHLVSAYRSIEYQCEIIKRKLAEGKLIEDILAINAIPGRSEHHTGRALDLHTGEGKPLELEFEAQPLFAWLCNNAARFNFYLSYPLNNSLRINYEPWHWCFSPLNE